MDLSKYKQSNEPYDIDIYLTRVKETKLNEVSVTASRVKFYYKGDTLVYNASAFITPEGSMLDALLNQIPDIKLTDDGTIYHKGKRIETLLLNGKDLFDRDRNLMLKNIGAFTVRDLNLYNQTGRDSELLGYDIGDSKYVMNVRLKKQYSHGITIKGYIGVGSHDRYEGNLFGLWFSDNVSMSASTGTDNINPAHAPSLQSKQIGRTDFRGTEGQKTSRYAKLTYSANGSDPKWKITGDARYSDNRPLTHKSQVSQNFLPDGDTYSYLWSNSSSRTRLFYTAHTAEFSIRRKVNLTVEPYLTISETDSRYTFLNATMNREITEDALATVENIYSGGAEALADLLNRRKSLSLQSASNTNASISAKALFSTGRRSWVNVNALSKAFKSSNDRWQIQEIGYGGDKPDVSTLFRHFNDSPYWYRDISASAFWNRYVLKNKSLVSLGYSFFDYRNRHGLAAYGENRDGTELSDQISCSMLPSMTHNLPEMASISYLADFERQSHKLTISSKLFRKTDSYNASLYVNAVAMIGLRNLRYRRGTTPYNVGKTDFLPGISVNGDIESKGKRRNKFSFALSSDENFSSLMNMVDIVDDTDPLNIYLGNPHLRNYRDNRLNASFRSDADDSWTHSAGASYNFTTDANAKGYYYNTRTGVRTFRTYNINGNYSSSASYRISRNFTLKGNPVVSYLRPASETSVKLCRNVDLVGTTTDNDPDFSVAPPKRTVRTLSLHEHFEIFIDITDKVALNLNANFDINRFSSSDPGFSHFTSRTSHYDAFATVRLPWNASLNTDIGIFSRRGFNDRLLNSSDVIWNASVAKSIMKGKMTFTLSAVDLLRQLRTVSYTINAQAKTETVTNALPAYVMISIMYHVNKQPRKMNR